MLCQRFESESAPSALKSRAQPVCALRVLAEVRWVGLCGVCAENCLRCGVLWHSEAR